MSTSRVMRTALLLSTALVASGCGGALNWVPLVGGDGQDEPKDIPAAEVGDELARLELRSLEDPADPYWPFRIAEIRAAGGDSAQAEAALQVALMRDPGHAPSLALQSKLWFDAGRHEEAVDLLERARARQKLPEVLGVALALHYDALGELDVADRLVSSLAGDLGDWEAGGSALTYIRLRGDGFLRSEDLARKALEANPNAVNHNNFGIAKLYAGDPVAAREHFEKAYDKDPELPGPLYNLAIVDHFYLFDSDGARGWFQRYRELSDDDPDGLEEALSLELAKSADAAEPGVTP